MIAPFSHLHCPGARDDHPEPLREEIAAVAAAVENVHKLRARATELGNEFREARKDNPAASGLEYFQAHVSALEAEVQVREPLCAVWQAVLLHTRDERSKVKSELDSVVTAIRERLGVLPGEVLHPAALQTFPEWWAANRKYIFSGDEIGDLGSYRNNEAVLADLPRQIGEAKRMVAEEARRLKQLATTKEPAPSPGEQQWVEKREKGEGLLSRAMALLGGK